MTEAEKREKVIRGLECHATKGFVACQDCPYYPDELIYEDDDDMDGTICEEKLAADALALLKEQEARVVNVGDFYGGGFGYLEYRSDRPGFSNFEPSPVLIGDIDEENVTVIFRSASVQKLQLDRMNKNWRIWNEYPTHELLRTVKWE